LALRVTVVGSQDRELETVLRACGATLSMVPMSELAALAHASTKQPDLIVLDVRAHPVVPPGLSALRRQHGGTGVIIVAKTLEPELILSAMRAGANECVAEPVTQTELDAAITRIAARQSAPAGNQSLAFVGVKGGVGATVLAVNVATALARVATAGAVLVDLHVTRGEAALYLGLEPRFTIVEALDNLHKLDDAFFRSLVVRAPSHLDLLAAPADGAGTRLDAARVRTLLEFTSKHFEYTIVDVPRTDPGALDALDGMKTIVVVTTQELPSVRSAAIVANRLRQRYGKERVMVVMNRADEASDIRPADVEQVLGARVAHTFPSDYRVTMNALNRGRPVVLDNDSHLAASFEKFARSLAGLKVEKTQPPSSSRWLGRLTGRK
jgi:pilus assembly protein CpaE